MTIQDIEKTQELLGVIAAALEEQQEVMDGLHDSLQAYLEFLNKSIKEMQRG